MSSYLYQEVKNYLLSLIKENQGIPNYKLPSENQIVLKFNTSRITAKRALSELQDEGLIVRYKGKGSFINTNENKFSKNKVDKNFVCLIVPNSNSEFITSIIKGIKLALKKQNYNLMIIIENENESDIKNLINNVVDFGIKGIIILPHNYTNYNKEILLLAFNKFPVVFIDRTLTNIDISSVCTNHFEMSKLAVEHLLDKGCKNIGLISLPPDYSSSCSKRISGFERAHIENSLLVKLNNMLIIEKKESNLKETIKKFILNNNDFDGLISYGDDIGLVIYEIIQECDIKVPENLKIVFFDNEYKKFQNVLPFSATCVVQKSETIGETAANLILKYITSNIIENEKILIDAYIVEKNSTMLNVPSITQ